MPYSALFSLLCSALINGPAATNNTDQIPGFTEALSGCYDTVYGATASEPLQEDYNYVGGVTAEAAKATRALSGYIKVEADPQPALKYSNIPVVLLDTTNPIDRVAALVSSNEGKPTSIDWNDNGKGVSVGIFQANQKVGELPDLLHELATTPGGHEEICATLGPAVCNAVCDNPEKVRTMRFSPKNPLGKGLQKLVHSQLFQRLQVNILRRKVVKAANVAADYGIKSTAGVAVCADLTNQWGFRGAHKFLKAAESMQSEGGKVKAVVNAVARSPYANRYLGDLQKLEDNNLSFYDSFWVDDNGTIEPGAQVVDTPTPTNID